jgi:hypothetical protein
MAAPTRDIRGSSTWSQLIRKALLLGICIFLIHQLTREPESRDVGETAAPEAPGPETQEEEPPEEPQRMRVRIRTLAEPAAVEAKPEPAPEARSAPRESAAVPSADAMPPNRFRAEPGRSGGRNQVAREVIPSEAMITRGERLVAELEKGEFPAIVADYRLHVGFHRYAQKMQELGARFFIMERGRGRVRWEVSFPGGALAPASDVGGLSPRSRRIVDEPAAEAALAAARRRQRGNYDLILLIPGRLEAYIVGALEQAAGRLGEDIRQFGVFQGRYHVEGGRLSLEFHRAGLKDGRSHPLSLELRI